MMFSILCAAKTIPRRCIGLLYRPFNPYLSRMSETRSIWKPLVWIDCEMTGLNHNSDRIIEICCIITDGSLGIVDNNCYESVIHCDRSTLDRMSPWCVEHHGSSGLTQKVLDSNKTREQVEEELLLFIKKYVPEPRTGILSGNSIHMDRLFMLKDFPRVLDHLHYRIVDVSTIMEVSFRHNPELASQQPKKSGAHTARKDILESIRQLRWYMDNYFKPPGSSDPLEKRTISDAAGEDGKQLDDEHDSKRTRQD